MKRTILFLVFMYAIFPGIRAQDLAGDILKINKAYSLIKKISMNTKYSVYRNHEGKELISEEQGFVKTDSSNQYTKIGPVETLATPDIFLMINHSDRVIIIDNPDKTRENNPVDLAFDIDKMIRKGTQAKFTKITSSIGEYSFELENGEYNKMNLRFGLKDFFIYRMDLYYRKSQDFENSPVKAGKPLMIIEYTDINKKPKFTRDTFSVEQFVVKTPNGYKAILKYKEYEIIDQSTY